MNDVPSGMQVCPTRVDGAAVLFAHTVSTSMCQQRQREHYHKCFSCVHNNARNGIARPMVEALASLPAPRKVSSAG